MDSPGHCAQFCTYTTIEQDSRDIVHIVSVDKRETRRNSVIMEKECFVQTMDSLLSDLKVKEVVTDAHPQISALLNPQRGKYKEWHIQHSLDIWHAAKSLCKKLHRVAAEKQHRPLQVWIRDIGNHFWYCCKQATTEVEFKQMWIGVLHHIQNEHSWSIGECQHEPLDEASRDKPWIEPGSAAMQALTAVVLDKRWLTLVPKFLNFRTTSDLENFQNHILMYASKRMAYTPLVYKTRTLLAAIDYNKHNRRAPAVSKTGHKMYRRSYNKKSSSWSVHTVKEKKQYSYIPEIQKAILARRLRSGTGLPRKIQMRPNDPRRLGLVSSAEPPPSTEELVQRHVSRGDLATHSPEAE
ncbi:uncharacterized protein LOC134458876 [Engraulis encrasicolus]|uniref:uncharacterized protein LOC134458876 n=1 Tax=Engraulis encrasicolus TaxID=184585 RepID=UPI002FD08209